MADGTLADVAGDGRRNVDMGRMPRVGIQVGVAILAGGRRGPGSNPCDLVTTDSGAGGRCTDGVAGNCNGRSVVGPVSNHIVAVAVDVQASGLNGGIGRGRLTVAGSAGDAIGLTVGRPVVTVVSISGGEGVADQARIGRRYAPGRRLLVGSGAVMVTGRSVASLAAGRRVRRTVVIEAGDQVESAVAVSRPRGNTMALGTGAVVTDDSCVVDVLLMAAGSHRAPGRNVMVVTEGATCSRNVPGSTLGATR